MNWKNNRWIIISAVILTPALVAGVLLLQPSAKDVLVETLETIKTITDVHAVVAFEADTIEKDSSGTLEVWARRGEDGPGAFRIEVLESSDAQGLGAVMVSDGETLWAYSPVENKVLVGTREEAQAMMEESDFIASEFSEMAAEQGEFEHPEDANEAVEKLLEYVTASVSGSESVVGETTHLLELEPIPEIMPSEFAAVGGSINLWIGQESSLLLAAAYTGGTLGEVSITVLEYELNAGLADGVFQFEIPAGAEIVKFEDLAPQSLTLEEAGESAEFELLTPAETDAKLIDIIDVGGILVQRYTLPLGGSFTISQGVVGDITDEFRPPTGESQSVEVRGTMGQLTEAESGEKVLLTWTEGELFFSVGGDLSAEEALLIAESLQ
jgi:outer membrane lipoprotein-sorting protein